MQAFRSLIVVFVLLALVVFASRGTPLQALENIPFWALAAGFAVFAAASIYYLIQIRARRRRQQRLDPDEMLTRRP